MKNSTKNIRRAASLLLCGLMLGTSAAYADYPAGYYDNLNGKCGDELMEAIKAQMSNHVKISYSSGTWRAFRDTDIRTIDGTDYWWDMYSNNLVKVSSGNNGLNVEHSVANSWWGGTKNDAYKDIVHLNPSDAVANNKKANYPLCELANHEEYDNGVTFVGKPVDGQGGGCKYGYEPHDDYKGDFARAYMYMFIVYDDISWKNNTAWMYNISGGKAKFRVWASAMLMKWHANDPVSDKERVRNDGIYKHQENRNPFIDLPDLADHIWGDKKNVPYSINGGGGDNPPIDPDQKKETYTWLSSYSSEMDADWSIENITLPEGSDKIFSWKNINGKYYLNCTGYIQGTRYAAKGYAWSPEVDFTGVKEPKLSFEHAAKFQTNLREDCGIVVRNVATDEITDVTIPSWPAAGKWDFASSGTIDLSAFIGEKIQIGVKYESTASAADTWEVNNMKLTLIRSTNAIETPAFDDGSDDSDFVSVIGNTIIIPDGARVFDLNGRQVNAENVAPGVYIVAKPSFSKSVKVLVK